MAVNITTASREWASRPDDERLASLQELRQRTYADFERSAAGQCLRSSLGVQVVDGDDIRLLGTNGQQAKLTHWSFGQLSRMAGAPSDYLRTLPAPIVAECLDHGLRRAAGGDGSDTAGVLFRRDDNGELTCRSIHSTQYGLVWNHRLASMLEGLAERGWMVPPARPAHQGQRGTRIATVADCVPGQESFGLAVKPGDLIAPAGIYLSDRDLFVFLVHPQRIIRDGSPHGMMRGLIFHNSEVCGVTSLESQVFFLRSVCGNHICWDCSGVERVRIIHKGNAERKFYHDLNGVVRELDYRGVAAEESAIETAKSRMIGDSRDKVIDALFQRKSLGLSKKTLESAYDVAVIEADTTDRTMSPRSAWGFAQGLSSLSQQAVYADERYRLDAAAGKILTIDF